MSDSIENIAESLKELDDLELEILFVDNIFKKLKTLDKAGVRSEMLLFMYMSVIESLKKYKDIAKEGNRQIPHEDVLNTIISKGELFLTTVANDETKAPYVQQSLSDLREWVKDLLFVLKKELLENPKYSHLKKS